jgi:hypothetical protein
MDGGRRGQELSPAGLVDFTLVVRRPVRDSEQGGDVT